MLVNVDKRPPPLGLCNGRGRRHGDGDVCENFTPRDVIRVAVEMNCAYLMMTGTSYAHRTVEMKLCASPAHETNTKLRSMYRMKAAQEHELWELIREKSVKWSDSDYVDNDRH